MLDRPASRLLRFDAFALDLTRSLLLRGGEERPLRRQSFDVLRTLAERRGGVVSKDDLLKAVWPGVKVTDDSIVQCVKEIRRALGEEARWIIRTVPGRGYEFMAEATAIETAVPVSPPSQTGLAVRSATRASVLQMRPGDAGAATSGWKRALIAASLLIAVLSATGWLIREQLRPKPPAVTTMMAVPTLAVLPFTALNDGANLSGEARAFSDELATEVARCYLATMLSVKPAAVRSGEAADPKAVGRRLGVRYLLLGSLGRESREHGGTVRLVEAETGRELWERPFRYRPGERTVPAVEIAIGAIWLVLLSETGHPLPAVPEAGHYAIRAFVSMKDLPTSASFAGKALEIDRDWVPALLAYAWAQIMLGSDEPPEARSARLAKADEAVERAIELAPLNPLAYHRRGQVLRDRGDPFGAISANQQALKFSPNMSIAHVDVGMNKIDAGLAHEAIPHIVEAIRLSPKDRWCAKWYLWAGQAAVHTADYDTAVSWLRKAMLSDFQHIALRYRDVRPWLAVVYAGLGREEEGRALLVEEARERGALTIAAWRQRYPRGSGTLAEQRERIEGLLRRLGVPETEKGPDAAKREAAEKAHDP